MNRVRRKRQTRNDRGQVAGIEAVPFGVLVFVVGTLFLLSIWRVIDTKAAVSDAAREYVRSFVEQDDGASAAAAGERAAVAAAEGHGLDGEGLVIDPGDSEFSACHRVTVRVSYTIPPLWLPFMDGVGAFTVTAQHSEIIDAWRAGVPRPEGGTACG